MRFGFWFGWVGLLLTACFPSTTLQPTATPLASVWGAVHTIGQAQTIDAPTLAVDGDSVAFSWVGDDDTRLHHDYRRWSIEDGFSATSLLVLPTIHPYGHQLYPASRNRHHLLWLDRDDDTNSLRLFSALVGEDGIAELGPIRLSDQPTQQFTAINNADQSLWVVWSGGNVAEPSLFLQEVDLGGRRQFPIRLGVSGFHPQLYRGWDGRLFLFWKTVDGQVARGEIINHGLEDIVGVSRSVRLGQGDRLHDFQVGMDETQTYLFWNVTRADGTAETWFTSGEHDTVNWKPARRLGISAISNETIATGFNSGTVYSTSEGEHWSKWTGVLPAPSDVLPVVVYQQDEIGIVYFQAGTVIGYQGIVPADFLISAPRIATNQARHLYLTWSELTSQGYAELRFTTTQR